MRSFILGSVCSVCLALSSCSREGPPPTGPVDPGPALSPAAKYVVSARITPDPAIHDFSPFGTWSTFQVSVNLADLDSLRVKVNPRDLASDRVLEIARGSRPPRSDYCSNGAEWNDRRLIRPGHKVHLAACQEGPAVLVIETESGARIDTIRFEVVDPDRVAFDIELVFVDPAAYTEEQKDLFEQAARRWEAIITEDIPDADLSQPGWAFDSREHQEWWVSSGCYDRLGHIRVDDVVDDLRVFVSSQHLSGQDVLGQGGPFWIQSGSLLPVLASITVHEDLLEAPFIDEE